MLTDTRLPAEGFIPWRRKKIDSLICDLRRPVSKRPPGRPKAASGARRRLVRIRRISGGAKVSLRFELKKYPALGNKRGDRESFHRRVVLAP
jgi:hypothetical protein